MLPVSILYCMIALFWLQLGFRFGNITEFMPMKLKELIFTISTCLSSTVFCLSCMSWILVHCSEVVQLATSPTHLSIGWTLLRWVVGSAIFAFLVLFRWWLVIIPLKWLLSLNGVWHWFMRSYHSKFYIFLEDCLVWHFGPSVLLLSQPTLILAHW